MAAKRRTRTVVFAFVLVALLVLMLARLERLLVFFPSKFPEGDWQPHGLVFEDVAFQADDGVALHGWYVPAPGTPRAVVLYSHGNGGNVAFLGDILRVMSQELGLTVFAYDYRGYGKSGGSPDGDGILLDARAARRTLAAKAGIPEKDVVLLGHSLGGGVSTQLAAADGARALILECTFSSLPDVASHVYPWLPARWLMRHPFDSAAAIARYHGPLLVSHGDRDSLIPIALGKKLFAAANEPKRFVEMPGIDHNDFPPKAYFRALGEFIESL